MTMGMRFDQGQQQSMGMGMRPSPSLIAFTEILQLSGMELDTLVQQELASNPALSLQDVERCPACGDALLSNGKCYRCARGETLDRGAAQSVQEADDEEFDVFRTVADQRSMAEHLMLELAAVLPDADLDIAEFLVGELDGRGMLEMPLATVAASMRVDEARVERVLLTLQGVGPLGLGARSVAECLRIQLARWAEVGATHPLAEALIDHHLDDLAHGRFGAIAAALGATTDEVMAGRDFIRTHLRPYPIAEQTDLSPWDRQTGPGSVAPDVVLRYGRDGSITVEVIRSTRTALAIDPLYRELGGDAGTLRSHMSADEQAHVVEHLERARRFMTYIDERRSTMQRVTEYVARVQEDYIRRGPRHLRPLTRSEVAEALDLHESTISRATAGKHVMLPDRHVIPYASFFRAALSVQDVLRELVDNETTPLTDTELVDLLAERGFKIARRTVAKYRDQMSILPSALR
ncbi:MAG: RNA polymerase sigma-54 factor [Ardenticatenales bacterium]